MKFYQYIKEMTHDNFTEDDANKMVALIKRDCQPFIKEFKYQIERRRFLYRGMDSNITFATKTRRTNRKPVDMGHHLHDRLDSYFNEQFGWKARSSGVFVSTSDKQSELYGTVYMVFPIGKYLYVFNPSVGDLYGIDAREIKNMYAIGQDKKYPERFQETWDRFERRILSGYTDTGLNMMLWDFAHRVEVMLNCDKYYVVKENLTWYNKKDGGLEYANEFLQKGLL